jgi:hypothetical protein
MSRGISALALVQGVVFASCFALHAVTPAFSPDDVGHKQTILPFLRQHCLKCHGPEKQKADFRVDRDLTNDFLSRPVSQRWSEVLNQLDVGEMPPKDEPRPVAAEVAKVTEWITRERLRGEQARKGTAIVLRRLNRAEYNNTIYDLTGVDIQPADEFPADPPAGGFDNNGGVLTISPLHLELYVKAAQRIVDHAIVTEKERLKTIKWRFELENGSKGGRLDTYRTDVDGQSIFVNGGNNLFRDGMTVLRRQQWDSFAQFHNFKVPRAGYYTIRMRAAGIVPSQDAVLQAGKEIHRRAQQRQEEKITNEVQRRTFREGFEKHDWIYLQKHFAEDRRYRYGPPRVKVMGDPGSARLLGEFDVDAPENEPKTYEIRAWLEPSPGNVFIRNVYHIPQHQWNWWAQREDEFPRPELLIDWVELEGPIYDAWPPASHRRILIDSPHQGKDEEAYAREVLTNFMRRAYRRPLRTGEVDSKLALFRNVRPVCTSFEEAIKTPLIAILSSSHFLYLVEDSAASASYTRGSGRSSRHLNDFEIASRLSYFFWSRMPDDELIRLAEQRQLSNPRTLVAQANRMLADGRSEQFAKNFAGQWLKLRDVGANPPAQQIYPEYDDHLELSMRGESEAFFANILQKDLSVLNFIRSDFVMINERLARFYDIRDVKGDYFRSVKVPPGVLRGGLLTQASMLSVTSNGTRTSPVWRGVWILERILGDPPPPPPPNVGDIPPAEPGMNKATLRDRLRLHREQAQCARCHDKIDPLGLALENFNAAGEWRERESHGRTSDYGPNDPPIDAAAQLPDGTKFVGVEGLQAELLKREDKFLRCLATKLYVYALGRETGYADQPTIDGAVKHTRQNGYTLRSLIHHVVTSEEFRSK